MTPPEVSLHHVRAELEQAVPIIEVFRLVVDTSTLSEEDLRIRVTGVSRVDDETYVLEMNFDGYRAVPPFVEFVHPEMGESGTRMAYPTGFHPHPCICARYNRKTYRDHTKLHAEWQYGDWRSDPGTEHVGGMLNHIFATINDHFGTYRGRMG